MVLLVNGEMQLTPDILRRSRHAFDFPPFTEDLQPREPHQVCDFTPGGRFETDIN